MAMEMQCPGGFTNEATLKHCVYHEPRPFMPESKSNNRDCVQSPQVHTPPEFISSQTGSVQLPVGTFHDPSLFLMLILMPTLEAGRLYALDGGIFRAKYMEAEDRFELWTYLGREGHVVARTGFEIEEHGGLYDRIYDLATERYVVLDFPRFTLDDLQEVTPEQAITWDSTLSEEELYQRWPELRGRINLDASGEENG